MQLIAVINGKMKEQISTPDLPNINNLGQQECIPVGCVPPAALAIWGVSTRHPPRTRLPLPRSRHPPVNRMTDRCKNITLPQTSFAGGKNSF